MPIKAKASRRRMSQIQEGLKSINKICQLAHYYKVCSIEIQ